MSSTCTFFINFVSSNDLQDGKIPTVLILNIIVWIIFMSIFMLLRFFIWEYGKSALIYSRDINANTITYPGKKDSGSMTESSVFTETGTDNAKSLPDRFLLRERHAVEWIYNFIIVGFKEIKTKCGTDAYLYLTFECYIILLLSIYTVISCCFLLPVNYVEGKGLSRIFERTTVTSLNQNAHSNEKLWLHCFVTHGYVVIALVLMFSYSRVLAKYKDSGQQSSTTLMIQHINKLSRIDEIKQHFAESEIECIVENVYLTYNTRKIHEAIELLSTTITKLNLFYDIYEETGLREWILVGWSRILCINSKGVDAIDYFRNLKIKLTKKVQTEQYLSYQKPLGIAFATFSGSSQVEDCLSQYQKLFRERPTSSVSSDLSVSNWKLSYAPHPKDIEWQNLGTSAFVWWVRWSVINFLVLCFIIFFTTPAAGVSVVNTFLNIHNQHYDINDAISDVFNLMNSTATEPFRELTSTYATPLIQILLAQFIPRLVLYSCNLESHWTKSGCHKTAIIKTFICLQLMLLIFPSLSLTSFDFLFKTIYTSVNNVTNSTDTKLEIRSLLSCVFLPEGGVFFVNYIITSAFFTVFQLLQLPNFFKYTYRKITARTIREVKSASESCLSPFNFGFEYAWLLVKVSIVVVYSTICPLITVGGLLYIIMKFSVDKYCLYYIHCHAGYMGGLELHRRAVRFLIWSHILLQVYLLILSIIRVGGDSVNGHRSLIIFNSLILSLTVILCVVCLGGNCVRTYLMDVTRTRFPNGNSLEDLSLLATTDRSLSDYICPDLTF